jgi:hypothetical protein
VGLVVIGLGSFEGVGVATGVEVAVGVDESTDLGVGSVFLAAVGSSGLRSGGLSR